MQVNETLVDAQLVAVPSLGTLTVRGLTGGNLKDLGRQTNGTLASDLFRTVNGVAAGTVENVSRDY